MNAIYHWVGFVVVHAAAVFVALVVFYFLAAAWAQRPRTKAERYIGNAFVWVWVFLLGKRWHIPLEGAWLLLSAYRQKGRLAGWERDIMAVNFRYNRRIGWRRSH